MRPSAAGDRAVLVEKADTHIAVVTLNRPEARNAVNSSVARGLARAVAETEADPDIWAVVLTAAGDKVFCAGADLKIVAAGQADTLRTETGGFGGFVYAPRVKPWIAAIDGLALAGGFEIALACDMIVASHRAEFALPEVSRGLIAAAGGLFRLPRALPKAIAMELIATGGRLDAARAFQFGLVNRVVESSRVRQEAMGLAAAVCANAPAAVRESLGLARISADLSEADLRQLTEAARTRIMSTADYREGPLAFIEKRLPRWTGR